MYIGAVHEYSDVADNFTNDPTTTLVYTQETGFLYGGIYSTVLKF